VLRLCTSCSQPGWAGWLLNPAHRGSWGSLCVDCCVHPKGPSCTLRVQQEGPSPGAGSQLTIPAPSTQQGALVLPGAALGDNSAQHAACSCQGCAWSLYSSCACSWRPAAAAVAAPCRCGCVVLHFAAAAGCQGAHTSDSCNWVWEGSCTLSWRVSAAYVADSAAPIV
jgi:hypothetical protein